MNLGELRQRLDEKGIRRGAYSLCGENIRDEKYCIDDAEDGWHVYYSERGKRNYERVFNNEQDACDYFLEWFVRDLVELSIASALNHEGRLLE